jgi:hypothetical protein
MTKIYKILGVFFIFFGFAGLLETKSILLDPNYQDMLGKLIPMAASITATFFIVGILLWKKGNPVSEK